MVLKQPARTEPCGSKPLENRVIILIITDDYEHWKNYCDYYYILLSIIINYNYQKLLFLSIFAENSEKCILYFLVCIFLGIILVLIVLILHSVHRKRKSERYQFPAVGVRLTDSSNSLKWRMADSESSVDDVDDVRRTPEGPHTAGPGRQWGPHHHGRPIRAWSPPRTTGTPDQTSTTVNPTQLEAKPNGVRLYGPRLDERGPRSSSEEAEAIPLHVGRTQSLTRGPHPNEPQYFFHDPKSLTIQPTSRRNVEL